jgi:hypothetical protein
MAGGDAPSTEPRRRPSKPQILVPGTEPRRRPSATRITALTTAQLRKYLEQHDQTFPADANRATLIELARKTAEEDELGAKAVEKVSPPARGALAKLSPPTANQRLPKSPDKEAETAPASGGAKGASGVQLGSVKLVIVIAVLTCGALTGFFVMPPSPPASPPPPPPAFWESAMESALTYMEALISAPPPPPPPPAWWQAWV